MIDSKPVEILLVEDNPGDVDLIRAALRKSSISSKLTWVPNGVQALAMLQDRLGSAPLPDIILLDWNLPKKGGDQVLQEIKCDRLLRRIPVIVLTSSTAPSDIGLAYDLGANCYLPKSVDLAEFRRMISIVNSFWFNCACLPAVDHHHVLSYEEP